LSKQSSFARGALTLSLAGAASLAMSAAAGANVLLRPAPANTLKAAASHFSGKRPYLARRPRVGTGLLVLGGGGTLSAVALDGVTAALAAQPATSQGAGSILGYFNANAPAPLAGSPPWAASYCQTASGPGRGVMDGQYGFNVSGFGTEGLCPPNLLGTAPSSGPLGANEGVSGDYYFEKDKVSGGYNGFNAAGASDTADFATSDAPEALSDYTNAAAQVPQRGEIVQIPYLAGSIGIAYNYPAITGTLRLTAADVCQIADGEITNWDQIPVATDSLASTDFPSIYLSTGSPVAAVSTKNPAYPNHPIAFVYRSDGSGTTFSFTNWLSAGTVVSSSFKQSHCTGVGETWGLNQTFLSAVPTPSSASHAGFVGASGNPAVVATIDSTPYSIGYAEAANQQAIEHANPSVVSRLADIYTVAVNNNAFLKDPLRDLPTAARYITSFKKDYVVNFTTTAQGRLVNTAPGVYTPDISVLPTADIAKAGCLGVVDPASYASPPLGYPIVAVSNLQFYSSGNGIYTEGLRYLASLTANLYSYTGTTTSVPTIGFTPPATFPLTTIDKASTTVAGTTGFSTLGIPAVFYSNPYIGIAQLCIN
jgi:phosphate transport system substrate-binding protein